MFKVNNELNFEHISHLVLVFLLLTLSRQMPAGLRLCQRYIMEFICDNPTLYQMKTSENQRWCHGWHCRYLKGSLLYHEERLKYFYASFIYFYFFYFYSARQFSHARFSRNWKSFEQTNSDGRKFDWFKVNCDNESKN